MFDSHSRILIGVRGFYRCPDGNATLTTVSLVSTSRQLCTKCTVLHQEIILFLCMEYIGCCIPGFLNVDINTFEGGGFCFSSSTVLTHSSAAMLTQTYALVSHNIALNRMRRVMSVSLFDWKTSS